MSEERINLVIRRIQRESYRLNTAGIFFIDALICKLKCLTCARALFVNILPHCFFFFACVMDADIGYI